MNRSNLIRIALASAVLAIGVVSSLAQDYEKGALAIDHPWARPSLGNVPNGVAYMSIINKGGADDRLVEVRSSIAKKTQLHTLIMEGDVMRMRRIKGGIHVPAGGSAKLQPGGFHVMLFGLGKRLNIGDRFPLTLNFRNAGDITVDVVVEKMKSAMKHNMKKKMKTP